MSLPPDISRVKELVKDKTWRLNNMYLIIDEDGNQIPFRMREEQKNFLKKRRKRNFIPKARKLGLSTIIILDNLDEACYRKDTRVGIIDLTRDDAYDKLDIARKAWERGIYHPDPAIAALWKWLHESNPLVADNSGKMEWANGSNMSAGTSYTGKTPQRLHISEYGPISAISHAKATAIKRGSINSVPPGGICDIETTMEGGQFGPCYHFFSLSMNNIGKTGLTDSDWYMQFFSWLNHPSYLIPNGKPVNQDTIDYFNGIKSEHGVEVPLPRQAWYERKKIEQGEDIYQQFPTVVEECDRMIVPGQIYPELKTVRKKGRVSDFSPEKGLPWFTSWDLGSSDNTAAWLIQPAGKQHCFYAWAQGEGEGAQGVAELIREWEREFGITIQRHLLPHDAEIHDKGSGKTYTEQIIEAGIPSSTIVVVPRIPDVWVGIGEVRSMLENAWFHQDCDQKTTTDDGVDLPSGVQLLEGYRKKLDRSTGIVTSKPVHDESSHIADAIRTYAEALSRDLVQANVPTNKRNRVTVRRGHSRRRK